MMQAHSPMQAHSSAVDQAGKMGRRGGLLCGKCGITFGTLSFDLPFHVLLGRSTTTTASHCCALQRQQQRVRQDGRRSQRRWHDMIHAQRVCRMVSALPTALWEAVTAVWEAATAVWTATAVWEAVTVGRDSMPE
jgi:hypothetical protein